MEELKEKDLVEIIGDTRKNALYYVRLITPSYKGDKLVYYLSDGTGVCYGREGLKKYKK